MANMHAQNSAYGCSGRSSHTGAIVSRLHSTCTVSSVHLQLMKDHGPKRSASQIFPTTLNNAQQQSLLVNNNNNNVVTRLYSINVQCRQGGSNSPSVAIIHAPIT